MVGNLNNIVFHENNVTFVRILRIFIGNKTPIAKNKQLSSWYRYEKSQS